MGQTRSGILFWLPGLDNKGSRGGSAVQTLRLATGVTSRSHSVFVVAAKPAWCLPLRDCVVIDDENLSVIRLPSPEIRVLGSIIYLIFFTACLVLLWTRVGSVHIASINTVGTCAAVITRLLGKRVIARSIGGDAWRLTRLTGDGHPLAKIQVQLLRFSHCIVSQGPEPTLFLIQIGIDEAKIVEIPNGVDVHQFLPNEGNKSLLRSRMQIPGHHKLICFIGGLRPIKRVDLILQAFKLLLPEFPNCRLLIVGQGRDELELKSLTNSLGLRNVVRFEGHVNNPLPYLQASDIFVLASDMETHSNALIEAMSVGLPVIATDVGGNRECVRHGTNGLLVPPSSASALAEAILMVLSDDSLACRLGLNARKTVTERYSLEAMIDSYARLYKLPNSVS